MHKEELSAALSRYHALGGDALLENFDYDLIPEGVCKRLEVAEDRTKELMRQDQWMRLGRQPLTDCGIQFQLAFEGMFKDLKRKFEAHLLKIIMPVLQFPDSSYFVHRLIDCVGPESFPITKREFIGSIGTPLLAVAERTLHSTDNTKTSADL